MRVLATDLATMLGRIVFVICVGSTKSAIYGKRLGAYSMGGGDFKDGYRRILPTQ